MSRFKSLLTMLTVILLISACSDRASLPENGSQSLNRINPESSTISPGSSINHLEFNDYPEKRISTQPGQNNFKRYLDLTMDQVLDNEPWDKVPPTDVPTIRIIYLNEKQEQNINNK